MKNKFSLGISMLLLFVSNFVSAQIADGAGGQDVIQLTSRQYPGKIPLGTIGTPYPNKQFTYAKVGEHFNNVFVRYNAYKDEFEFIDENKDTLVMNKSFVFSNIKLLNTNTVYHLVNYTQKNKAESGYLVRSFENNDYILYKKIGMSYFAGRKASSSYDQESPAKYSVVKDKFFFKNKDNGISEFPANKKAFIKLFPDKEKELETYFKSNNTNFDNEVDLIQLVSFVSKL
jgi:hypothetical protein